MNDFTKEELEIIYLDICVYLNKSTLLKPPKHHVDLKEKIKCMIDNYCEHKIMTENMKECQATCTFHENGKIYFTLTSDVFAYGSDASLDIAHKIIAILCVGQNKFQKEWIDKIIFRLEELKSDN